MFAKDTVPNIDVYTSADNEVRFTAYQASIGANFKSINDIPQ